MHPRIESVQFASYVLTEAGHGAQYPLFPCFCVLVAHLSPLSPFCASPVEFNVLVTPAPLVGLEPFNIHKRYSEFPPFHSVIAGALDAKDPAKGKLPVLPPKQWSMFGSSRKTDAASVQGRMKSLREYANSLLSIRELHNNPKVLAATDRFFGVTSRLQGEGSKAVSSPKRADSALSSAATSPKGREEAPPVSCLPESVITSDQLAAMFISGSAEIVKAREFLNKVS